MSKNLVERSLINAHKVAFICNAYPEKKIGEIGEMFMLAIMEFNTAVWRAEELNYIEVAQNGSGEVRIDTLPKEWKFDEDVTILLQDIPYVLKKFAVKESDIEENYLTNWTAGFPSQDVFIAIKKLLADGVIATYNVINVNKIEPSKKGIKRGKKTKTVEDTYTFYTLPENAENQWGRKQFPDQDKLKK